MPTIWFCLVAAMIVMYVVLDGFDLGAGIVGLFAAKTDDEKRLVLRTIGPVWDGNEVWLIAAGGTLYFAFPKLYAASFSGFYLPLMIVLWLLMLRGVSIEFRGHVASALWQSLWGVVFGGSSLLLVVFFGAALGNVVRGVPLDASGRFFEPLWTDFGTGEPTGILDWYTVLAGLASFATLTVHGALWVATKTDGPLSERARRIAARAWWGVVATIALLTVATLQVQPLVMASLAARPWGAAFPLLAAASLVALRVLATRGFDRRAFLASCTFIAAMLVSVVFGLYPYVLPSHIDPAFGLTVHNAAAADAGLRVGLLWWIPGMALATGYFVYLYRRFAGKVRLEDEGY
ncbi:MAG: cytochrome d ubiquinol oxidase subunit II [Planctomycetes bacterium]|nr:cytochrome d ubiquinol oxidase subunit II [Planctomycetota bacterium]MBI3845576.1 cytochrome d ubiquinol oxidase subunit II [Planctomycetota bacterium]